MTFVTRLRLVFALAGLVFALVGMATDNRIVIWVAIGLLGVALLLRLFIKKHEDKSE